MAERPLIGVSPDQVSTNGMLGDLAFQDSDGAYIETIRGAVSLDKLDKEITDTAVDIFVYDTRKDSDGGAWRKRTQHTSWYNETLNTAYRGSRREFPAVAVIVATADDVIIYDGDDPDLPMWMVFESDEGATAYYTHFLGRGSSHAFSAPITSISMLNGLLSVGKTGSSNFLESFNTIDFIKEDVLHRAQSSFARHSPSSISNRNNAVGFISLSATGGTVNHVVNDVAMTVLPNAPIDSATGLPVPTIAVATDGGVSVIRDDGTVVDLTYLSTNVISRFIDITSDGKIRYGSRSYSSDYNFFVFVYKNIPSADTSAAPDTLYTYTTSGGGGGNGYYYLTSIRNGQTSPLADCVDIGDGEFVISTGSYSNGGQYGIHRIVEYDSFNSSSVPEPLVAIATTSFNTGWMHGNIKGAFLSDTDATNVSAVVVNSSTSDWSQQGTFNWTITSATEITVSSVPSTKAAILRLTTDSSKHYVYSFNITSLSDNLTFRDDQNNEIEDPFPSSTGVYTGSFTGTSYVQFTVYQTDSATITDIDIREAEEDRSVNANGLGVYGTITKSAVATGAELVAYSGFDHSNPDNYLYQPYNSGLNFGTGDFSISFWVKPIILDGYILDRSNTSTTENRFAVYCGTSNSGSIYFYTVESGVGSSEVVATNLNGYLNTWINVVCTRDSSRQKIFINGEVAVDNAKTARPLNATTAGLYIGIRHSLDSGEFDEGSIALLRLSASIPSAEQIKKIYEDEKVLFQENAACTLYGSSDAVTALAYDDSTNLLYAGTSSGRSDFQGLRRINNTTTAVTTAISASNGLIAEQ